MFPMARPKKRPALASQVPAPKKHARYANAALISGVLSVVPLLNMVAIPLGIIFGVMGVVGAVRHPATHTGLIRAIIGLTVCVVWLVMTIYAMLLYGPAALLTR